MDPIVIDLRPTPAEQIGKDKAHAALAEFFNARPPGPFHGTAWMGNGYLEASVFNNRVHLSAVFVLPELRGQKLGSTYLKEFLEVVDKHGAEVECSVKPFGEQVKETKKGVRELTKWYKTRGFQPVPKYLNRLLRPAAV